MKEESKQGAFVLEARNLSVAFRDGKRAVEAVSNISFTVGQGETAALVGESGSGKSVTSLSILRLVERSGGVVSGNLFFHSPKHGAVDLLRQSEATMRSIRGNEIAMIFQEPMTSLNPVLTVGYQVSEALRVHKRVAPSEAKREALELLNRVRIPDPKRRFDDYPRQFSGGMRQRVMIAMALACRPKLLVADEPTTALDVTTQAGILDLIRGLQEEMNMSVLFISHDLGVVSEIADRVLVMYSGKIVENAPIRSVFFAPAHPYTSGLLHSMPATAASFGKGVPLRAIPGSVPPPGTALEGCAFASRCEFSTAACETASPRLERRIPGSSSESACHRAAELNGALASSLPWVEADDAASVRTA